MAVKSLQYFKDKFKTGYKITEEDYADWLDSFRHAAMPINLADTAGLNDILSAYRKVADQVPAAEISGLSQFIANLLNNYLTTNSSIPISQVDGLEAALENIGRDPKELEELKSLAYYSFFNSFLNHNFEGDLLLALSENPGLFMELVLLGKDINTLKQLIIDEIEYPDPIFKIFALSYLEVIGGAYALAYARNPELRPQLSSLFYEATYGYGFSGQPNSPIFGINPGVYKQQIEAMSSNPSSYYPFIVYSLALVDNNLRFIEGLGENLITFSIDNDIYSVADEVLYVTLSNTPKNTFKIQDFFDSLDVSINISVEVPTSYNGVDFNTTLTTKEYILGTQLSMIPPSLLVLYKFDDDEEDYVPYDSKTINEPGEYIYVDAYFKYSLSNFLFKTKILGFHRKMNLILDIPIYHIVVL